MRTKAKTGNRSGPRRAKADSVLAEMAQSCSVGGGLLLTVLGFWWRIFQHTEAKTNRRIGPRCAEAFSVPTVGLEVLTACKILVRFIFAIDMTFSYLLRSTINFHLCSQKLIISPLVLPIFTLGLSWCNFFVGGILICFVGGIFDISLLCYNNPKYNSK